MMATCQNMRCSNHPAHGQLLTAATARVPCFLPITEVDEAAGVTVDFVGHVHLQYARVMRCSNDTSEVPKVSQHIPEEAQPCD